MAEAKKLGSSKRFGARYGRTVKQRFAKIEKEQRRLHKCPYCNRLSAKRVANGIWRCKKCSSKFTGKAHNISKPAAKQPSIEEEKAEEKS
ncbi:50S ribosomal protein L37ae [Candidatus Woesearchaeota archaeon]|nr:50S ribosomal protein L37ae [Candidatus Woesearchaeota archaeon]